MPMLMHDERNQGQAPEYYDDEPLIQGICKDCGNGTLNNHILRAFGIDDDGMAYCVRCDSHHVEVL
jgi:hypothetical protein